MRTDLIDQTRPRHATVLLRHTLPGGPWHLDWLTDSRPAGAGGVPTAVDPDERRLVSFRLPTWPSGAGVLDAVEMVPHRAHYLRYEGDLGTGRGHVQQIARGWVLSDLRHSGATPFGDVGSAAVNALCWSVCWSFGGEVEGVWEVVAEAVGAIVGAERTWRMNFRSLTTDSAWCVDRW